MLVLPVPAAGPLLPRNAALGLCLLILTRNWRNFQKSSNKHLHKIFTNSISSAGKPGGGPHLRMHSLIPLAATSSLASCVVSGYQLGFGARRPGFKSQLCYYLLAVQPWALSLPLGASTKRGR